MLPRLEIAFWFIFFEHLRLEREQILLGLQKINLWQGFRSRKLSCEASGASFLGQVRGHEAAAAEQVTKSREVFIPRTKD